MENRPISEHLHFAIASGNIEKVQQLLSSGADANSRLFVDDESLETVSRKSVVSYHSLRNSISSLKRLQVYTTIDVNNEKKNVKDENINKNLTVTLETDQEIFQENENEALINDGNDSGYENEVDKTVAELDIEASASSKPDAVLLQQPQTNENKNTSEEEETEQKTNLTKIIKVEPKSRSETDADVPQSVAINTDDVRRRSLADVIDEKLNDNNEILIERRPSVEIATDELLKRASVHTTISTTQHDENIKTNDKQKLLPRLKKKISFKKTKKNIKKEEENNDLESEGSYGPRNYGPQNVDNDQLDENFEGIAFFEAVKEGMGMIVQTLLETSNNNQLNMIDDDGFTPVMQSAWHGQDECLQILLDHGADTSLQNATGCTAAHFAAGQGNTKCLEILAKDQLVDINCQTKFGATPLILAAQSGHSEAVRLLLHYDADINIQYRGNQNALLFAAGNGHYDCIELLVQHNIKLDQANTQNVTSLMRAVQQGHNDCVELLVAKGANLNVQDTYGRTAAHLAVENHNSKALEMLVKAGADLTLQTKGGNTTLDYTEKFKDGGVCLDIIERHSSNNNNDGIKTCTEIKECTLHEPKTVKCIKLRNVFKKSTRKQCS